MLSFEQGFQETKHFIKKCENFQLHFANFFFCKISHFFVKKNYAKMKRNIVKILYYSRNFHFFAKFSQFFTKFLHFLFCKIFAFSISRNRLKPNFAKNKNVHIFCKRTKCKDKKKWSQKKFLPNDFSFSLEILVLSRKLIEVKM